MCVQLGTCITEENNTITRHGTDHSQWNHWPLPTQLAQEICKPTKTGSSVNDHINRHSWTLSTVALHADSWMPVPYMIFIKFHRVFQNTESEPEVDTNNALLYCWSKSSIRRPPA